MESTNVTRPVYGIFNSGHASPSRSLDSLHPTPCDHPPAAGRQCHYGQEPIDSVARSAEINGSVMAAVGYHKKHLLTEHDCGETHRRCRSNTVPTALLRRLRNGAEAEVTSVHATADGLVDRRHHRNERAPSLESLESRERRKARTTRRDEIVLSHMKHKQQDHCCLHHRRSTEPVVSPLTALSPAPPSEELSAVTLLDHCMDAADDEFYTVYRDPLPKGSSVFEKVLHEFEPDCSAPNGPVHLLHVVCNDEDRYETDENAPSSPTSPRESRHVHWVEPPPCENVA